MNSAIIPSISPQEVELERRRRELAHLQTELTEREVSLADLQAQLASFQGRNLREVGVLYAELDDWKARIAELLATNVGTDQAQSEATEARAQANESRAAAQDVTHVATDFSPSPELKKLFREVVNQIHPDRASSLADQALREHLMKQANAAYRGEDSATLRTLLEEYRSSPEAVGGAGAAADLERIIRLIARIAKRLAQIEAELSDLTSSEMAMLMATVASVASKGRDLLSERALDVSRRIQAARREYEIQLSKLNSK